MLVGVVLVSVDCEGANVGLFSVLEGLGEILDDSDG